MSLVRGDWGWCHNWASLKGLLIHKQRSVKVHHLAQLGLNKEYRDIVMSIFTHNFASSFGIGVVISCIS